MKLNDYWTIHTLNCKNKNWSGTCPKLILMGDVYFLRNDLFQKAPFFQNFCEIIIVKILFGETLIDLPKQKGRER